MRHTHKLEMELPTCVCTYSYFCHLFTDPCWGRMYFSLFKMIFDIISFYFIYSFIFLFLFFIFFPLVSDFLFYSILYYLFCFILSQSGHLCKDVLLYHTLYIDMPIASSVYVTLRKLSMIDFSHAFSNAHAVNCLNISLKSWCKCQYTCSTPDCGVSTYAMLTLMPIFCFNFNFIF